MTDQVACPICDQSVPANQINAHIDAGCTTHGPDDHKHGSSAHNATPEPKKTQSSQSNGSTKPTQVAQVFLNSSTKKPTNGQDDKEPASGLPTSEIAHSCWKRKREEHVDETVSNPKRPKISTLEKVAPLAERMRPKTLDQVQGQKLVGSNGVLRSLVETDRVPSMILWGGPGTGKTTIARLIAQTAGTRFVEINSTSSGVAECKKLFAEARNDLNLTGRKTIIFCDEIHRFSKSQQDVFLAPVESGVITLIGATTENPSFKVINALLSRCRTFVLDKLSDTDITSILHNALDSEALQLEHNALSLITSNDFELLTYLATFSDGDARTGLNLLSLAIDLSHKPDASIQSIKSSLTQTMVYDRAGDQHYDTISAFHKSVRGSDADAALYYLARMLTSGEDPLYIARRMVVIASEDIGLADNTMLPLATATYAAAQTIGMPECRINMAHCAVALCLAPKSTRAYRAFKAASSAVNEPGVGGLPVPVHLRNAPTRLMKELGYGKEYKYNPEYVDGKVAQEYLPDKLVGRKFLEDRDLGVKVDQEVEDHEMTK